MQSQMAFIENIVVERRFQTKTFKHFLLVEEGGEFEREVFKIDGIEVGVEEWHHQWAQAESANARSVDRPASD